MLGFRVQLNLPELVNPEQLPILNDNLELRLGIELVEPDEFSERLCIECDFFPVGR